MNITSTTVIKTAFEQSKNARYHVDYILKEGLLTRVFVTIYRNTEDEVSDQNYIGTITMEDGYYNCYLPTGTPVSPYFADMEEFVEKIGNLDAPVGITEHNN